MLWFTPQLFCYIMICMDIFAKRLKTLRQEAGISQGELARTLGVSKSTIGMYEAGHREPSFQTLVNIAKFFHVPIDALFEYQIDDGPFLDGLVNMKLACAARRYLGGLSKEELEERKEFYRKTIMLLMESGR